MKNNFEWDGHNNIVAFSDKYIEEYLSKEELDVVERECEFLNILDDFIEQTDNPEIEDLLYDIKDSFVDKIEYDTDILIPDYLK